MCRVPSEPEISIFHAGTTGINSAKKLILTICDDRRRLCAAVSLNWKSIFHAGTTGIAAAKKHILAICDERRQLCAAVSVNQKSLFSCWNHRYRVSQKTHFSNLR